MPNRQDTDPGAVAVGEFRAMMSRFPTGVAIVTSVDAAAKPRGMTCSSLASVCLDPPTLMVCLRTASATCGAVRWREVFAVNVLGAGGQAIAETFASAVPDRFAAAPWRRSAAGLPWLAGGAIASADCLVRRVVEVGDHTAVFGEVRAVSFHDGSPLLYGLRSYATWRT